MAAITRRILIAGAAGRDFHNFLVACRDNPDILVAAFTATQIPDIAGRVFPAALAGPRYPHGIPILEEQHLEEAIKAHDVDEVMFAYSDVTHAHVMHLASRALAAGASFSLLGPKATMLRARRPVVSVCAVRTGAGKSQTARRVVALLRKHGARVAVVRHPMPYGDLTAQAVQRFTTRQDLLLHRCTIEEREEYEPHLDAGAVVYAGVDYAHILTAAEDECDVVVWDGGNNDFSFFSPELEIAVVDPLRPGHELNHHPGETVLRRAQVVIINKVTHAAAEDVRLVERNIAAVNPTATVIHAASVITVEGGGAALQGKRVVVVEDGPTLTHGGMAFGAGTVAAREHGATVVSPQPFAVGSLATTYAQYPHAHAVLPAMGYSAQQLKDLKETILATAQGSGVDLVLSATPMDLKGLLDLKLPLVRVGYELQELGERSLEGALAPVLARVPQRKS